MTGRIGQVRWEVENLEGTIEAIADGVAAALDVDEFRIGRIAETADHMLTLDRHGNGSFQIGPVLR